MYNEIIECTGENLSYINDYLIRITAHYTDSYAADILHIINSIEEQLKREEFKEAHKWYLCFYRNGVEREEDLKNIQKLEDRRYRAVYSYTLSIVGKCGFKEPKITIQRSLYNY